jgi:hypothetical protein
MRYNKWTDRIADKLSDIGERLSLSKETWIHIGMAVGIAVVISVIILITTTPRIDTYNDDINQLNADIASTAGELDGILGLGPLATDDDLNTLNGTVADHTSDIGYLNSRINDTDGRINAITNDLEGLVCSPPDAYLTGIFGNYTLHIKSSKAGNFTANVNLIYSTPIVVGNATTHCGAISAFYASINWTAPNVQGYVPTVAYNGAAWGITKVSLNIGTFALAAGAETTIDIILSGLNSTYKPSFAYIDIYPTHI